MLIRKLRNIDVVYENHKDLLRDDCYYAMIENILEKMHHKLSKQKLHDTYSICRIYGTKNIIIYTDSSIKESPILLYLDTKEKILSLEIHEKDLDIQHLNIDFFADRCNSIGTELSKKFETTKMKNVIHTLLKENNYYEQER